MKQFFAIVLIVFSCYSAFAQHREFQKLYSTSGPTNLGCEAIEQANGDILLCGIRSVPTGGGGYVGNVILMRTDKRGNTIWTKELGTPVDRELAFAMEQLPGSDLIIVGSINTPPNAVTMDALIIRCDTAGNIKWQKRYDDTLQNAALSLAIDGNSIIVCGDTYPDSNYNSDLWLLKLDMNGDTLWARSFGDTSLDDPRDVAVVNGEYYVAGGTYNHANGQYNDVWLLKVDANGNKVWSKTYGVANRLDMAWAIEPAKYKGVVDGLVMVGLTNIDYNQTGFLEGDMLFMKVDTSGTVIWNKAIQGTPYTREAYDIKQLSNENFVISGFELDPSIQCQQFYTVMASNTGDVLWDTAYGTVDSSYMAYSVGVCRDGGWLVTGAVFTPNQPIRYIYMTKFLPSNVNIDDVDDMAIGITVYPNPAKGVVYISADESVEIEHVAVYSIDGRQIKKYKNSDAGQVEVKIETPGTYMLEIKTANGVVRKKVISTM